LGRVRGTAQFTAVPSKNELPSEYGKTLAELKSVLRLARVKTVLAANVSMVLAYWDMGRTILLRQKSSGWGAKIIDRLSADLHEAFPEMQGLSPRNLKYMRAFAAAWPNRAIVQRIVAQLPWRHNIALIERLDNTKTRMWYAQQTIQQGWSQPILCLQIEQNLHERQGRAITNFPTTLPPVDSDMAAQIFKDPYLFDFVGTADPRRERELEQALVEHIQKFLLELGAGFAFVGRQVHLEVGDKDFYLDLLFYHLQLRAYVVIELKATHFDSSFVGQMNLYLSAVDDLLRHQDDKPTIGLLLCRDKNKLVAEYALRDVHKPIGVANWTTKLMKRLPSNLRPSLPTVQDIEKSLKEIPKKKKKEGGSSH